jgi:hypothetical protein
MNRFFSIPAILRLAPQPVLLRFFQKMGLDPCAVDWQNLSSGDVRPIIAAISGMAVAEQMAIANVLYQIADLACESGIAALREAGGETCDMHLAEGPLCAAMQVWIDQPEIFELATILHTTEYLLRWRRRIDLPKISPKLADDVLSYLGKAIASLLNDFQVPCGLCSVEYMRRPDGTDSFVAFPDGSWHTTLIHDANGELVSHRLRPVLEIVFVYDRAEGVLETCADLPASLELQLENVFCQIVLDYDASASMPRPAYDLNVLKDETFHLVTEPEDQVDARVSWMQLVILNSQESISLAVDPDHFREGIYPLWCQCVERRHLPLSVLRILEAEFCFEFATVHGRRQRSLTLNVCSPDLCTLRGQTGDGAAVAWKYLRKWRIAVA